MRRENAHHRLVNCAFTLVFAVLLSAPTACSALDTSTHAGDQASQKYLQRAVSCLVGDRPFQDYALKLDKLRLGDWALAKYHMGSVVDRSYKGRIYNVVLYSSDMKRSIMGSVIPKANGDFEAVQNGYLLVNHSGKWDVQEGNGGYRDYETVGRFVTSLSRVPFNRVRIVPKECSTNVGHSNQ